MSEVKRQAQNRKFTVVSNVVVAKDLFAVTIYCPDFAQAIRPGQFLNIKVPNGSELLRIPVSYSDADPHAGTIEIVYAVVGNGTRAMSKWEEGFESECTGVLGNGWLDLEPQGKSLLIAGGCGVTPILGLARYFGEHQVDFDAIIGSKNEAYLFGATQTDTAGANRVVVTTDDGSCGMKGFTVDALDELLKTTHYDRIYTCGPHIMMKGIRQRALAHNIALEVSLEKMMSCGFGACNTCNVLMKDGYYSRCCTDGPVYMSEEVAW